MNTFTDMLRVASLPLDIQWAEKEANLEAVRNAMMSLPEGTDIVVLPELFRQDITRIPTPLPNSPNATQGLRSTS